jgi:hypothetical protein
VKDRKHIRFAFPPRILSRLNTVHSSDQFDEDQAPQAFWANQLTTSRLAIGISSETERIERRGMDSSRPATLPLLFLVFLRRFAQSDGWEPKCY